MKSLHAYFNPNPLKKETGDCVVRALVKATGKSWEDVYTELFHIGFELKVMPNNDEAWKQFLINHGFEYVKLSVKKGKKRPTVNQIAKENKENVVVIRVANHIVTATGGKFYDVWDSGTCSVYGYWVKK